MKEEREKSERELKLPLGHVSVVGSNEWWGNGGEVASEAAQDSPRLPNLSQKFYFNCNCSVRIELKGSLCLRGKSIISREESGVRSKNPSGSELVYLRNSKLVRNNICIVSTTSSMSGRKSGSSCQHLDDMNSHWESVTSDAIGRRGFLPCANSKMTWASLRM